MLSSDQWRNYLVKAGWAGTKEGHFSLHGSIYFNPCTVFVLRWAGHGPFSQQVAPPVLLMHVSLLFVFLSSDQVAPLEFFFFVKSGQVTPHYCSMSVFPGVKVPTVHTYFDCTR